jgi:eukaryotic-like serine/threonine-protein kinase
VEMKIRKGDLVRPTEAGLIMELLDAEPLDARMHTEPLPTISERLEILLLTSQAMSAINKVGYVHCDMKPGNIMLCSDGSVRVIDLGQSCPNNTTKPRVQGSPHYISPEQYRLRPITYRTDVFNFGATAYWLITGKHISTYYTRAKGLTDGTSDTATPPHEVNPQCPHDLSNLILQAIKKDPAERPSDMHEVSQRVQLCARALGSGSVVA